MSGALGTAGRRTTRWRLALPAVVALALQACTGASTAQQAAPGSAIQLSLAEQSALDSIVQDTLESRLSGESTAWRAAERPLSVVVTPVRTYPADSTYCREYEEVISFAGASTTARRIACRAGDGVWRVHDG
ncbi:MAG: hypothetical protein RLO50_00255 [Azospirillaceae bacterium]